MEFSKK